MRGIKFRGKRLDMRQIKFRGKQKNSKIWFYGGYVAGSYDMSHNPKTYKHYIITDAMAIIEVDPDSVGQYTDLKDKNGMEIFEGDIVTELGYAKKVEWSDEGAGWVFMVIDEYKDNYSASIEVIGNIYDNPELLK